MTAVRRHPERRRRLPSGALAACVVGWIGVAGCLPSSRINAECRWSGDTAALAPPGDPARLTHLREDVRIAQDLGVRHDDATAGRANPGRRGACTSRLLGEIAHRHQLSPSELEVAGKSRESWIDLLLVFVPTLAILLVASRQVSRRVVASYAPDDRLVAAAVLLLIAPLVGAVSVQIMQMWGVTVEQLRLGNEHISYRGLALPARKHALMLWGGASAVFAGVAMGALFRAGRSPRAGHRWR